MKKLVLAFVASSFLMAGAAGIQAAAPSQPESATADVSASDQQQTPKKHHSHKGRHHHKQPQQTQGGNDQENKK